MIVRGLMVAAAAALLLSCATPEERVAGFTESGDELLAEGQVAKAVLEYRNALQIDENHLPALRGLLKGMEAQSNQGQIRAILNKLVELDKADADARIRLARRFLLENQMDRAKDLSDEALALEADNARALAVSAAVLLKLEDAAGAVAKAEEAVAADPATTDAYAVLAAERVLDDDIRGAIAQLDRGISAGDPLSLRLIKIQMLQRIEDIESAIGVYERLIQLQPDDTPLKRSFAYFLTENDRLEDARPLFQALAEAAPESDEAVIDLVRFENTVNGAEAAQAVLVPIIGGDPKRYQLRRFLAELKLSNNQVDAALDDLGALAKDAGNEPLGLGAKARQAEILVGQGKRAPAEALITEILEADERQAGARALRAQLAIEDRRIDDAISDLRTILRDVPSSVPALGLLGRAHDLAGSTDLAEERYAAAFQASRGAAGPSLTFVQFLLRQGKLDLAEDVLAAALQRAPENLAIWRALAQVRLQKADWVGAQQVAARIEELNDDAAVVNQIKGAALGGQNRLNESLDAFKQAHEAAPASARPLVNLIRAYVATNRVPDAVSFLETLVEGNPDNTIARILLAQSYGLNDQPGQAEMALKDAQAAAPDSALIYQSLYQYYLSRGQQDEATATINQASQRMPENQSVQLLQAGHFERLGQFEDAIGIYENLYKQAPNSPVVANNLASLIAEHRNDTGSLERARVISERFRDSQVPHFRDTLGWAYFRTGDTERAVDILESVVEQLPSLAIFRYHLGEIYLADGQVDAGKKELQEALTLSEGQGSVSQERILKALEGS